MEAIDVGDVNFGPAAPFLYSESVVLFTLPCRFHKEVWVPEQDWVSSPNLISKVHLGNSDSIIPCTCEWITHTQKETDRQTTDETERETQRERSPLTLLTCTCVQG